MRKKIVTAAAANVPWTMCTALRSAANDRSNTSGRLSNVLDAIADALEGHDFVISDDVADTIAEPIKEMLKERGEDADQLEELEAQIERKEGELAELRDRVDILADSFGVSDTAMRWIQCGGAVKAAVTLFPGEAR